MDITKRYEHTSEWLKVKQENPEEYKRIYHRRNVSRTYTQF